MIRRMLMRWAGWGALGLLLALGAAGCGANEPTRQDFAHTALGQADHDQAFAAAEKVMRSRFGRATANREKSQIESEAEYFQQTTSVGTSLTMRRRATLQLLRRSNQWWAYVQVPVERSDTEAYQMFDQSRVRRDWSVPTPMESGETTPMARKQAWRRVRREYGVEQDILGDIREELGIHSRGGGSAGE